MHFKRLRDPDESVNQYDKQHHDFTARAQRVTVKNDERQLKGGRYVHKWTLASLCLLLLIMDVQHNLEGDHF